MDKKQTLTLLSILCVWSLQWAYADVLTYEQAEAQYLDVSHGTKASAALQQASIYQAQAVKHLGLPRVDLNVRAYKLHAESDVPLDGIKRSLTDSIHDNIDASSAPPALSAPVRYATFERLQRQPVQERDGAVRGVQRLQFRG